jgi:tetratricopeptide (TPR) repeat protein
MKRSMVTAIVFVLCGLGAAETNAQGAMARGQVLDEQGQPLADVRVELHYKGREPETFVRTTNEKGAFVQVGLPSGPYEILYSKEGYNPVSHRTQITAGGLTEIPDVTMKVAQRAITGPEGGAPVVDVGKEIEAMYAQAVEATRADRLDEGEALYKEILEMAPQLAVARYNLGYIYQQKEDWAAAEAEYRKVIELQPEMSDTYSALAAVCEATGRSDEALEVLATASSRFQDDANFQFNLGVTYLNAGQDELAAEALHRARDLDPETVEADFYLGTLAIGAGQLEDAVGHLEAYISASGQNPRNLETAQKLLETLKSQEQ